MKNQHPQNNWGILGLGYVGKVFSHKAPHTLTTQRTPQTPSTLPFTLENPKTWTPVLKALETVQALLWTLPAASQQNHIDLALAFARQIGPKPLIVLGTTSRYENKTPGEWVDETTPLVPSPRTLAEEALRQECQAIVLVLSRLWGPHRDPTQWLLQGRIPSPGYINLIHVDNICDIILEILPKFTKIQGQAYNLTATPQLWGDVAKGLQERQRLKPDFQFPNPSSAVSGKRVSHQNIKDLLPHITLRNFP